MIKKLILLLLLFVLLTTFAFTYLNTSAIKNGYEKENNDDFNQTTISYPNSF